MLLARILLRLAACLCLAGLTCQADAGVDARNERPGSGTATIALASNFLPTAQRLKAGFEESTDHRLVLVAGSSGQLYAQIINGAPFDVFLSADAERPAALAASGEGVAATRSTYALGRLALWAPDMSAPGSAELSQQLCQQQYRRIAIANPALAPYGQASLEALTALDARECLQPRIVRATNIAQVFAMADTGNADLALIAWSHIQTSAQSPRGHIELLPDDLHPPIRQDMILLRYGAGNPAARAFVEYLQSDTARQIIRTAGYEVSH